MEISARAKIKRAQRNANTSGSSISDPGVPRTSHARQAEQFLDTREFKIESSAKAKIKGAHRFPIVGAPSAPQTFAAGNTTAHPALISILNVSAGIYA